MKFFTLILGSALLEVVLAGGLASTYYLSENIVGNDFYRHFDWQAKKDPTNGRV